MTDKDSISKRMKADWDRRVDHDYLFWMSDGRSSEAAMWESGKRDFQIITKDISDRSNKSILEIGCGVGRLMRPAVEEFGQVVGIDVSEVAIKKAKEFLGSHSNLRLYAGSGVDLQPVSDQSIDVVFSFAAITSMPVEVIAKNIREAYRILKPGGVLRLQVYLGEEQDVASGDTLHMRCFQQVNFESAMHLAGFNKEWLEELRLPFEVSFKEAGITAFVCSFVKSDRLCAPETEISNELLPGGERQLSGDGADTDLEYWMTVSFAEELAEDGDVQRAQAALDYANVFQKTVSIDVRDVLDRVVNKVDTTIQDKVSKHSVVATPESLHLGSAGVLEKNLRVLQDKFPQVYDQVFKSGITTLSPEIRSEETAEGPVIFFDSQVQDHVSKPVGGGRVWAERAIQDSRLVSANHVVAYGFGAGYHIEALASITEHCVSVIEPRMDVFKAALALRDLESCFSRLQHLIVAHTELDFLDEKTELLVRPQSQVGTNDFYSKVRNKFYGVRGLTTLHPSIAVLGPIQGGTLPMLTYCTRALSHLEQRVRPIDMKEFAQGYHSISKLIANDTLAQKCHGNYIEMMSQVVLDSISEKPVDILIVMAQAPLSGRALTELRKQGVTTALWFVEDYHRFNTWQTMAPFYDFIFTIQRGECIDAIKAAGCQEVHYLPTAADPHVHMPVDVDPGERNRWGSPISFVGAGYHNRVQMFASLANHPFKIWGTEWPEMKPFDRLVQEKGRRLTPEEYIKIFNTTDININLHSSSERDGIDPGGDFLNPRTFELSACGAFQLVDPRKYLEEVFTPGEDIETFYDINELKEKIDYYLAHPEERAKIAARARETVLAKHTYEHRIREMLSIIYSARYEHLQARYNSSPWSRIMERSKKDPELHVRCQHAFKRGEEPGLDGLLADIVTGKGALSETEQKLLFMFHVSKQMIRMKREEIGDTK